MVYKKKHYCRENTAIKKQDLTVPNERMSSSISSRSLEQVRRNSLVEMAS